MKKSISEIENWFFRETNVLNMAIIQKRYMVSYLRPILDCNSIKLTIAMTIFPWQHFHLKFLKEKLFDYLWLWKKSNYLFIKNVKPTRREFFLENIKMQNSQCTIVKKNTWIFLHKMFTNICIWCIKKDCNENLNKNSLKLILFFTILFQCEYVKTYDIRARFLTKFRFLDRCDNWDRKERRTFGIHKLHFLLFGTKVRQIQPNSHSEAFREIHIPYHLKKR